MRLDLAVFVCCCKSFLSADESDESNYYALLGLERDASPEDVKKAYKKKSLQMHRKSTKGLIVAYASSLECLILTKDFNRYPTV